MRQFLQKHLGTAILAGLWATALYAVVLHLFEAMGIYYLVLFRVPDFCYEYWSVFPGAAFLSLVVLRFSAGSRMGGALLGGLLAPLNAPFAVLLNILAWELQARMGLMDPWRYGFEGLWGEWVYQLEIMLVFGAPVAIPCGLLMGAWLGSKSEDGA